MFTARLVVGFSLALALTAPGAWASDTQASGVTVDYVYPTLTLGVSQPTDLQTVLEAICQRTEASCEIAPGAAQVVVPPVVLTGSWAEVIAKLFEGTKLDYAWVLPVPGRVGRLLVMPRSALADAPRPMGEEKKEEARRRLNQEVQASPSGQPVTPVGEPVRRKEVATSPDQSSQGSEAFGSGPSAATKRRAVQQEPNEEDKPNTAQDQAREAAVWSMITGHAANPGQPASTPGTITLPVPDRDGNPILVPATSQGLIELPFPDPRGWPIRVTPLRPGESIPNPFMPSDPHPK